MSIAFDRLIESKRGNAIDFCQVAIQHHSHAADCADHSVNLLYCDRGFSFLRHRRERLFKNSSEEKREERMKEEIRKFATANPRTQAGRLSVGGEEGRTKH
jgi:hypothetical protein